MSIQQRKLQNINAKIDVTGEVHSRQSSSRPSAVQRLNGLPQETGTSCFSPLHSYLGLPWTMSEDDTHIPSSGVGRHATHQGTRLVF